MTGLNGSLSFPIIRFHFCPQSSSCPYLYVSSSKLTHSTSFPSTGIVVGDVAATIFPRHFLPFQSRVCFTAALVHLLPSRGDSSPWLCVHLPLPCPCHQPFCSARDVYGYYSSPSLYFCHCFYFLINIHYYSH